ncbi:MAG: hypothetical protein D4R97_01000, partial [Bacteroidetes bacterium]
MKSFNLINLFNAEINKTNLSNVRGGGDVKCICGNGAPSVTVFQQSPAGEICVCPDGPNYSSTKNNKIPD